MYVFCGTKMVLGAGGRALACFYSSCTLSRGVLAPTLGVTACDIFQVRNYAARKGTREKARKKKVKVEVKKVEWIPHNQRKKKDVHPGKRVDDSHKPESPDDVWISKAFRWPTYDFAEAIECHRETHHPTVINCPSAVVYANIELDMRTAKETRFVEPYTKVIYTPHPFESEGPRPVLALCKTHELQKSALEAGATVAGDTDLIKSIQNGDLNLQDFKFVVAHPNILTELVSLRGLLKRKFPSQKIGTLGMDIGTIVSRYVNGIEYKVNGNNLLPDLGWTFTAFGKLDMETSHLEENFIALLEDVNSMRPKREGPFITKCCLVSLPSKERLKVNYKKYLGEEESGQKEEDDESDDEEERMKLELKKAASSVA